MYIGKVVPMATRAIFGCLADAEPDDDSGSSPSTGHRPQHLDRRSRRRPRRAGTGRRSRRARHPSTTPMASPIDRSPQRDEQVLEQFTGLERAPSRPAAPSDGAASVRSSTTPVELRSCQATSSRNGPASRRTHLGRWRARWRRCVGHASDSSVPVCARSCPMPPSSAVGEWCSRRGCGRRRPGRGRDADDGCGGAHGALSSVLSGRQGRGESFGECGVELTGQVHGVGEEPGLVEQVGLLLLCAWASPPTSTHSVNPWASWASLPYSGVCF